MSEGMSDLMASFHRCRQAGAFIDTFYDVFLSKSTEIAERFVSTDFQVQKLMLRESLLEMLCFDRGLSGARRSSKIGASTHQAGHQAGVVLDVVGLVV